MLRYQLFTGGHKWREEYGFSDEPDQVDNLLAYSPVHTVKPVRYPGVLI